MGLADYNDRVSTLAQTIHSAFFGPNAMANALLYHYFDNDDFTTAKNRVRLTTCSG